MARRLAEQREMREAHTDWDGTISETRFFKVSRETWEWLQEHGQIAAVSLCDWSNDHIISVAAYISPTGWNGWHWIHDEFKNSGLEPRDFIMTGSR